MVYNMAKEKALKAPKPPREVKRNIPAIDIGCAIATVLITLAICALMTYLCTWWSYLISVDADVYNTAEMMKYIKKNINFMTSYIFCGVVLWGTIGFILSTLAVKLFKHIINYK